jgi:hypothetical protein
MGVPALAAQVQGQGSVSADNLNTYTQSCDIVARLRNLIGLPNMQILLLGISAPNDGGQGAFYWATGSGFVDDGFNTIVPTGTASGAWIRVGSAGLLPTSPLITVSGTVITKGFQFVPINNTTGLPFSVLLSLSPVNGETHTIKDWAGNAASFPITILGNGNLLDAATSYVLAANYQSISMTFVSGKWSLW